MAETSDSRAADAVVEFWDDCDKALLEDRRHYWLNLGFYRGHQWLYWDPSRRIVQTANEVGSDSTRVRTVVNKIQPRLNALVGRLAQTNLTFEVPPTQTDDSTVAAARLSEQVLMAEHEDNDWEWVRAETLFNTFFGGTAAISVEWDGSLSRALTSDDQLTTPAPGGLSDGSLKLRPLAIPEFSVEPGARRYTDSNRWISCVAVPPKIARSHYSLGYDPEPDTNAHHSAVQAALLRERGVGSDTPLVRVFTQYEKPSDENDGKGSVTVVANRKIVHKSAWPFPFDDLNLQVFRQQPIPGSWTGTTMLNAARNPQVLYNALRSIIIEHSKMAGNARLLVPRGSLLDDEQDLTDEAGEIVEYDPIEGAEPHYMTPAQLARYVYLEPENLERELDDIMHTHAVSRGVAPGDRNSGAALAILAERNDTPLGPMAREQANGWAHIASLALRLYGAKVREPRTATVWYDDVPRPVRWNGQALRNQFRVRVPLESTTPTSKAARTANLIQIKDRFPEMFDGIDPRVLIQWLDVPGLRSADAMNDADARRAQKENELVGSGEVIEPKPYDDHARHIAEHNRFRKTDAYLYLEPEKRQVLDLHVEAHQRLLEEEAAQQAALNAVAPGLAGLPQANEPIGSAVPPDQAEMGDVA